MRPRMPIIAALVAGWWRHGRPLDVVSMRVLSMIPCYDVGGETLDFIACEDDKHARRLVVGNVLDAVEERSDRFR